MGGNSYQLGGFPAGWSEWNGSYPDLLWQAQNDLGATSVTTGQLATRFAGSSDLFRGRKPWNSTNFMLVHDGFTRMDLYSCNCHSTAAPRRITVGTSSAPLQTSAAARVGFAFLMVSTGTTGDDGRGRIPAQSQLHNNAYNVDSIANWLNYNWTRDQSNFNAFVRGLIAFRKTHAALRPLDFYSSAHLTWWTPARTTPDAAISTAAAITPLPTSVMAARLAK